MVTCDMTSSPREKLIDMGRRGVFRTSALKRLNIPRTYLQRLVDRGELYRVDRGLYTGKDARIETHLSLAEVAARYPESVVGLLSALRFHELTTENPAEVYILLPKHSQRPRMSSQLLNISWVSGKGYSEGIETHAIAGVPVKITCPAKTVVDCFKFRTKVGVNVAAEALRDAWRKKKVTADELMKYARICRMTNVMRPYFEMLVA